jgi:hypothetical protein
MGRGKRVLLVYDASAFVGLQTIVYNAAIERQEDDGEVTIELPKLPELMAAAAISRCLMSASGGRDQGDPPHHEPDGRRSGARSRWQA